MNGPKIASNGAGRNTMPHEAPGRVRVPRRAALLAAAAPLATARAQPAWPSGPVRIVVPFPPGGSVDQIARLLAPRLSADLGVPVVVENRGGAAGSVGTNAVAKAGPDGNTWAFVFDTHAVNPTLIPDMPFDTRRDLAPVMLLGTSPMGVLVTPGRPWRTFADLLAAARARPDTITFATIGNGSLAHLTMILAQAAGGFSVTHVPYRGGGPALVDALGGVVDLLVTTPALAAQHIRAGTVRALVQTGAVRSPAFPDAPTLTEAGVPGVTAEAFWGVLAPARTPEPIVARFHAALTRALAVPEVRAQLEETQAVRLVASSPPEFGAFLDAQIALWGRVVRDNAIRPD